MENQLLSNFLRRPPTRRIPSLSRKGSSRYRLLDFFSPLFRSLADILSTNSPFAFNDDKIFISSLKCSYWTSRVISSSARWSSSSPTLWYWGGAATTLDLGFRDGDFFTSRFFSRSLSRRQTAIALLALCHSEKRSNLLVSKWPGNPALEFVARATIFLNSGSSGVGRSALHCACGCCSSGFQRNWGPVNQLDSFTNWWAASPREVVSAGLDLVSTLLPVVKDSSKNLRRQSSLWPRVNTERFKNSFFNRLIFKYNLALE